MMDAKGIADAAIITWTMFGLIIDKYEETTDQLTFWISVPATSYIKDANEKEMSGMHLAKRFRTVLTEMGVKRLKVLAKVRENDNWTEEKSKAAEIEAKKSIYGSQW